LLAVDLIFMSHPSDDIQVSVFARTDTGLRRAGNEDAFMIADLTTGNLGLGPDMRTHKIGSRGSLMVVSDGMGGAAAGEIASEMAVKIIRESLMQGIANPDVCGRLQKAAEKANEQIWNYARQHLQFKGMGATLTAVLIQQATAFIAQIGDSRAYLVRGNRIKQLTKDQSLVQALIDSGAVAPEQANTIPQNVITQALGTSPTVDVAISSVELSQGDTLIVCSDGLSNKVKDEEMVYLVQHIPDLTLLCRTLVEWANHRGGEDNITVITAKFDGELLHSAAESSITASFQALSQGCTDADYSSLSYEEQAQLQSSSAESNLQPITLVFHPINMNKKPSTDKQ
jgi:serine/threonine protein phosphatase PrpC